MSSLSLSAHMTGKSKAREELLTVRASEQVHRDFKAVAELRGLSMSALVHSFIVREIREEKSRDLEGFNEVRERQDREAEDKAQARAAHKSNGTPNKVIRLKRPNKKLTRAKSKRKLSG